jgi:hypothetical protein
MPASTTASRAAGQATGTNDAMLGLPYAREINLTRAVSVAGKLDISRSIGAGSACENG